MSFVWDFISVSAVEFCTGVIKIGQRNKQRF